MKKRPMTLLEVMIVIVLIGIVASVVGYNMKGALDKGKEFKTKQAQKQVRDILLLEAEKDSVSLDKIVAKPLHYLERSGLVKEPKKLLIDGWGDKLVVERKGEDDIVVISKHVENEE